MDAHPVEGVILGCTELPLILGQGDTELPLLDTVDIHVEAALDHALAGLV
jgi:aspartate racemase